MAEEEVNYSSVVFKTNKQPRSEVKREEETVYDEVKVQNNSTQQTTPDTNASAELLPDEKADSRSCQYQQLACCLGTLCVILMLGIIATSVYLVILIHESEDLNEIKVNQTSLTAVNRNLTDLNNKLSSDNEDLRRNQTHLILQIDNLTQAFTVSEQQIRNLTAKNTDLKERNEELKTQNQKLNTEKKNLTEQIESLKTAGNELNVSRAQWSIDAYCPKHSSGRTCNSCQQGWEHFQSSCYAINNPEPPEQKSWEEARENCRGKISDLAVVINEGEKKYVSDYSWGSSGDKGYWIGLKAEDGKWKWVDGIDLTENSWMKQPPSDGQCAISVQNDGFKSVSCHAKNQWICKKKALSV